VPFSGFQRAEPFGGYEVEKKAVKDFLLGKLSFARAFRNGIDKGSRGFIPRTIEVCQDFCKKCGQTSIVLELGYKFWGEFTHNLLAFSLSENGFPEAKKAIFEIGQRYANLPFHVKTAFVRWLFGSLWLTADGIA